MKKQLFILIVVLLSWNQAQSQSAFTSTEQQFHDLFLTAGYSTAFGAALGAAFIGLTNEPQENMHFIAIGASVGFIAGSLMGAYVMVSPSLVQENSPNHSHYQLLGQRPLESIGQPVIRIHPLLTQGSHQTNGLAASISFLTWSP